MKLREGSADTPVRFIHLRGCAAILQRGGQECPRSSCHQARRASVMQPRVAQSATLGRGRIHHLGSPNPNGVPSIPGGTFS